MTFLPAARAAQADPPRVGFALPRKVGPAVVRNRLRRQIQAHLRLNSSTMVPGTYLIALRPEAADLAATALLHDVDRCLARFQPRAA